MQCRVGPICKTQREKIGRGREEIRDGCRRCCVHLKLRQGASIYDLHELWDLLTLSTIFFAKSILFGPNYKGFCDPPSPHICAEVINESPYANTTLTQSVAHIKESGLLLLYPFLFAANLFGAMEEGGEGRRSNLPACGGPVVNLEGSRRSREGAGDFAQRSLSQSGPSWRSNALMYCRLQPLRRTGARSGDVLADLGAAFAS